ncbi:FAD-binding protein [Ochrobactrum tritici]|uniref:FAD-binding protein n=1 Tax=Brucella tritici TaxID=94626 RepID=A0A7X6JDS5_9HYPH|nr:FAD-binding protein [Brucella tritici]
MKTTPFWWEAAEPQHGERAFDKTSCSVLIIGSGYTGLSAAITLAETGQTNIMVVDAMRIGEGPVRVMAGRSEMRQSSHSLKQPPVSAKSVHGRSWTIMVHP